MSDGKMEWRKDFENLPSGTEVLTKMKHAARLLCGSLMWLEKHDKNAYTQLLEWPELADWWTEHQKADAEEAARKAKLIAEKKAKKAALKKLTPEERKLLGVGK